MFRIKKTLALGCILSLMSANVAFGISISPTRLSFTATPGEIITSEISGGNSEEKTRKLNMTIKDYWVSPDNGRNIYQEDPLPRGISSWVEFQENGLVADPTEFKVFPFIINVPEDATPGTYNAAIFAQAASVQETSGVGVQAAAIALIDLTIEGDYTENVTIDGFELNQGSFLKGSIVFDTAFNNLGEGVEAPFGNITIYDKNGEQVPEIFAITQEINDQRVVMSREDSIPFNPGFVKILPGAKKVLSTELKEVKLPEGSYTAKLEAFYGKDNTKLEAETEFDIITNFSISTLEAESYFNASLPIGFNVKLINTGTVPLKPTGYFQVTNIFGSQKHRVDFFPEELEIEAGSEKVLNNLSWDQGFALGFYNATLTLDLEGTTYSETIPLVVLSWWQTIIAIAVLALITLVLVKSIKKYKATIKKLKELEKK